MTLTYSVMDTREHTATLADGSVDLIFTSPPFLALRSYLPADHEHKALEIGSEANPAAFLDVLLELTAEWGRVLAPHGTLAVELGDTYAGGGVPNAELRESLQTFKRRGGKSAVGTGWPLAKSLALIPQLYAVALAYGINPLTGETSPAGRWRVRNWLAWHRPNPPVGALGDKWRPASSYVTVACRGAKRWFDLDAVRVPHAEHSAKYDGQRGNGDKKGNPDRVDAGLITAPMHPAGAPPLDWHTDGDLGVGHIILSTQPYLGSHYATFPVDLPRKIIDCMCPRQVCRVCGVARERVVGEVEYVPSATNRGGSLMADAERVGGDRTNQWVGDAGAKASVVRTAETLGWTDCRHDELDEYLIETHGWSLPSQKWRPGIVYDPFCGSGTTLEAAQDLGRDGIGCDIDARNAELARQRVGLFLQIEGDVA